MYGRYSPVFYLPQGVILHHLRRLTRDEKDYVARFLGREYQVDKVGARAAMFGHEASMEMDTDQAKEDLIARVGPWGAFRSC
ncbi:MAG TPA: hypothetical protein DE314_02790 [Sulfitobacter sp.]|nr:hypothetical protein [Sulfitobacter sp.]